MQIEDLSNERVRALLGSRLRASRKSRGLSQTELAERAGLSRPTVSTLERGNDVSLDTFLSVLRALDLLDALDVTVPEAAPSPIRELSQQARRREPVPTPASDWVWGDQR